MYQSYRTWRIRFKQWIIRRIWFKPIARLRIRWSVRGFLFSSLDLVPGSPEWLIDTETKYGGIIYDIPVQLSSSEGGGSRISSSAVGGDRMYHHGYAKHYSRFLDCYVHNRGKSIVICEVGVLKGTGLAIWCDLFPNARCIGLDVDLSNIIENMDNLRGLGAFSMNLPELFEYDQFVHSEGYVSDILNGDGIDIFTDDGHHSEKSIMTTLQSVVPHLNEYFVYFIEDNSEVHKLIKLKYPEWAVHSHGELTVITPSSNPMSS